MITQRLSESVLLLPMIRPGGFSKQLRKIPYCNAGFPNVVHETGVAGPRIAMVVQGWKPLAQRDFFDSRVKNTDHFDDPD